MSTLPTLQVIVLQLVADNPTLANNDPKYSTMINATIICVAIHSALSLSGNFLLIFQFCPFLKNRFKILSIFQVECTIQCWPQFYLEAVKDTNGQIMSWFTGLDRLLEHLSPHTFILQFRNEFILMKKRRWNESPILSSSISSLSRLSKQSMIRQNNDLSFQKLYFLDP